MNHFQKKTRKFAIALIACALMSLGTACNKHDKNQYNPAELSYFGFDSFPEFKSYVFYIDNFGHKVYNVDSFPFKSDVDSLFPIIGTLSSNEKITIDGKAWKAKQYFDWSSGGPFELVNHSEDGKHKTTYQVYVNIHQVDPDSMRSHLISNGYPTYEGSQKLLEKGNHLHHFHANTDQTLAHFHSSDGLTWTAASAASGIEGSPKIASICAFQDSFYLINQTGSMFTSADFIAWKKCETDYKVIDLHGELRGRKHLSRNALVGIVEDSEGLRHFARYEQSWTLGDTVPADFPVREYASVQSTTITDVDFIVITTGLTKDGAYAESTWSTMDGLYWARISNAESNDLLLEGACMFYYDNALYLLGGKNDGGSYHDLYISENHGISWKATDSKIQLKAITEGLVNAQVITDEKFIRVYGGNMGNEKKIWQAHLNRMLFEQK